MSFAGDVKNELCRGALNRKCCAQAECYGILLYCNTFSPAEVRIITESDALAQRLPLLFKKAFKLTFDRPFFFALKSGYDNTVLFTGVIANP